jgi:hypothetical protein
MWRRNHDQPVAQEVYMEPTMEDGYLETIHEVDSVYSRSRPVSMALPELPLYVQLK